MTVERIEYGHVRDCAAQGCPTPCHDAGEVVTWQLSSPPRLDQHPRGYVHARRWVRRTVTVGDWEPTHAARLAELRTELAKERTSPTPAEVLAWQLGQPRG